MQTFNNTENTKIYQSYSNGWTGETKVKVNGKNWVLTTLKRYNGTIATHCHVVQDEGNGNFSFMVFGSDKTEDFYLNILPKGTKATEKAIREAHFKALAEFDAKNENKELPTVKDEYKIQVGQVLFTDWVNGGDEGRRAVYEICGNRFKTVLLDGSKTKVDDFVRPYSKKFGIGVYYNEGDIISTEAVNDLLISAHRNMEMDAAKEAAQSIINADQAKERAKYLSQFKKADRRTTTNIIKRHILKTWPDVQKVEVKTDVFSGGDSMDVYYTAGQAINELDSFIENFKYGRFDGMTDCYNYDSDKQEIILEGHILQDYKYVSVIFLQGEVLEVKETVEIKGEFEVVDYSEKAIAVFGDTKAIKDELKALGGRFNAYLMHNGVKTAGWVFSKAKKDEILDLIGVKEKG